MADEGFKRKLAAILSADVKGYSRLMEEDEEATIRTITKYRKIIAGQIGFSTADAHTQRRVRYAMADRSQGEKSHLIVFVEMPVEVREANGTKGSA